MLGVPCILKIARTSFARQAGALTDAEVVAALPGLEARLGALFRELRGGGLLPMPATDATIAVTVPASAAPAAAASVAAALGSVTTALPAGAHDPRSDGLSVTELVAALARGPPAGVLEAALQGLNAHLLPPLPSEASAAHEGDASSSACSALTGSGTEAGRRLALTEARAAGIVHALVETLLRCSGDPWIVRRAAWLLAAVVEADDASFVAAAEAGALSLLVDALHTHADDADVLAGVCAALRSLLHLARAAGARRWSRPRAPEAPPEQHHRLYKFGDFTRGLLRTVSRLPSRGLSRTLSGLHELGGRVVSGDWPADDATPTAPALAAPQQPLPANFAAQVC